jgi:dolichyl-phosphate beta-glucosyltransferase
MTRLGLVSDRPVRTESVDELGCTDSDLAAVKAALEWAREFLANSHDDLGRKGPVCPYIRQSFDEDLLHVASRPDETCDSEELVAAVRSSLGWFAEIQDRTPPESRHLVTVLIVLPRIDRRSAEPLNELHRVLKDEFVSRGLMIGQFHPQCEAPGLWNPDFRPLQSPVPLLAIREMVSSDLPFLSASPMHAYAYLERFARSIPGHTRRYLVDQLTAATVREPPAAGGRSHTRAKRKRATTKEERQMQQSQERPREGRAQTPPRVELDLVIPVFNEERRIGATLAAIHEEMVGSDLSVNVLVVDNGCVDATAEVVDGARSNRMPVEIISCRTRGKGAAVRAGVLRSTAPFVGYCDADLSTPPSALHLGADLLRSGWEVVIGSRRCTGASYSVPQGGMRRLGSFAFRAMAARLSGPITDTQCGFKLFRTSVAKELFSASRLNGFAFDVEVLAQARLQNHRMIELPIQWSDDPESTFRPLVDGVKSFRELREARRSLVASGEAVGWR